MRTVSQESFQEGTMPHLFKTTCGVVALLFLLVTPCAAEVTGELDLSQRVMLTGPPYGTTTAIYYRPGDGMIVSGSANVEVSDDHGNNVDVRVRVAWYVPGSPPTPIGGGDYGRIYEEGDMFPMTITLYQAVPNPMGSIYHCTVVLYYIDVGDPTGTEHTLDSATFQFTDN